MGYIGFTFNVLAILEVMSDRLAPVSNCTRAFYMQCQAVAVTKAICGIILQGEVTPIEKFESVMLGP